MPDPDYSALPRTVAEARLSGCRHYFTGRVCRRGHLAPRHTANETCKECLRENMVLKAHGSLEAAAVAAKQRDAAVAARAVRPCSVEGCGRVVARGELCNMHRLRRERHGDIGPTGQLVALKGQGPVSHCGKPQCPAAKKLGVHLDYLRNMEAYKKRAAAYGETPEGKVTAAAYRAATRAEALARVKSWRQDNPGAYRAQNAKSLAQYRSYLVQATPWWTDWTAIDAIYAACPSGYHIDHLVPVRAKNVCGLHVAANLLPIPAAMNCSKGNRFDQAEMERLIAEYGHLLPG